MHKAHLEKIHVEKEQIVSNYKINWDRMITDWKSPSQKDAFWLMFSACYLFKTNNIGWALDPVSLLNRISKPHQTDFVNDLKGLSFVLISHLDADHFDKILINHLSECNIKWVIPYCIAEKFIETTTLKPENIVVVHAGDTINLNGITIKIYDGFHSDATKIEPSASFYVNTGVKKMFFPGDTRCYLPSILPAVTPVDSFFAHLWLGYESTLDGDWDLLIPFCEFCVALKPKNVILAHLFEVFRANHSYWNLSHAKKVKNIFEIKYPDVSVKSPLLTERNHL